jgi:hypothetical protein
VDGPAEAFAAAAPPTIARTVAPDASAIAMIFCMV